MPCYLYKCEKCCKSKEVYHGMEETRTVVCKCGRCMVKIIPNTAPPIIKGTNTVYKGK